MYICILAAKTVHGTPHGSTECYVKKNVIK